MNLDDTIVAIATPPGRGGIGVVRLAGPESKAIASRMLHLSGGRELEANRAIFGELVEIESGERIDEVVATWFAAPHSYTTDEIVEISCHGSPVVLRRVVEMAICSGCAAGRAGRVYATRLLERKAGPDPGRGGPRPHRLANPVPGEDSGAAVEGIAFASAAADEGKAGRTDCTTRGGHRLCGRRCGGDARGSDSGGDRRRERAVAQPGCEFRVWQGGA